MSSLIGKDSGLFDPSKRFAFTNITTEDFTSSWGGSPIVVKAGETVELPHHLANKMTDELVNLIMIGNAKMDEVKFYKENPNVAANTFRSPLGSSLGVPAARKEWEDKIVRELAVDEESPQIQVMRAKIKEELLSDLENNTKSTAPVQAPSSLEEFAELGKEVPKEAPKPIKVKKIAKPK